LLSLSTGHAKGPHDPPNLEDGGAELVRNRARDSVAAGFRIMRVTVADEIQE
jgi:hypothetical protein